jgi:O-methyltransferase domain
MVITVKILTIHNWSDEHCVKLLKNCYMTLPDEGKVIVVDYLLPVTPQETSRSQSAFIMDVMMLINCGSKERTNKEFENLEKEAGFTKVEAQYFWAEMWIIELKK